MLSNFVLKFVPCISLNKNIINTTDRTIHLDIVVPPPSQPDPSPSTPQEDPRSPATSDDVEDRSSFSDERGAGIPTDQVCLSLSLRYHP